jgi:DNA-binding GntR family transcriptional regulator
MKALEKECDRKSDRTARSYLAYNESVHRLIVQASRNPELIRLVENLCSSMLRPLRALSTAQS